MSCVITASASPPAFVFWYRDGSLINYGSSRARSRVTTDKGKTTVSRLEIASARLSDAGAYACKPSHSEAANTSVHILSHAGPSVSCPSSCQLTRSLILLGASHQADQQSDPDLSSDFTDNSSTSTASVALSLLSILLLLLPLPLACLCSACDPGTVSAAAAPFRYF